jgi:hypothetical protein
MSTSLTRFPILRAELEQPAMAGWTVLQPYFLAAAAVRLLGIDLDTRKGRVAVKHCESALQLNYINAPLSDSKPERALTGEEIALVRAQAKQITAEWQEVASHFDDEAGKHKAHSRADLVSFLRAVEPRATPAGPRSRLSALAG